VRGEVRITLPLVMRSVVPRLAALAIEHPDLKVRTVLTDRPVSLEREKIDVAVRIGRLDAQSLVRRPLRGARWLCVAAPSYLARRGRPVQPSELAAHDCLKFVLPNGTVREWSFREGGRVRPFVGGTLLEVDDGYALLDAALAGVGVAQLFDFMIEDALRDGRLVEVLPDFEPPGPPVHALCTRARRQHPNVRAVISVLERLWGRR
jgi:DNA-binding transcriptional LysR family regulator